MTVSEIEALQHSLTTLAAMLKYFYDELVKSGFDKDQAMQLTMAHMSMILKKTQ